MTTIDETAMQHTISRRSFVKGASALAAGGALASAFSFDIAHAEGTVDPDAPVEKRYTYCDMCNQVPKCGMTAYVQDGKIVRSCSVRVVRDGIVIHEGSLASLKRFKDDAREVAENYECGLTVEKFNDIKEGDIIEAFVMEEVAR